MRVVKLALLCMAVTSWGCASAIAERQVSVSVTIQTETGDPLRGIGVELLGCTDAATPEFYGAVTDDQGACSIAGWVCDDLAELQVQIWVPKVNGFEDAHAVFLEARDALEQWGFSSMYQLPVPAGNSAELVITVPQAVTVTGTLVDGAGNTVEGVVARVGGVPVARAAADGVFSVAGIPTSLPAWMQVEWGGSSGVQLIRLNGNDLSSDFALGDVVCDTLVAEAQLAVTLSGWSDLSMPWMGRRNAPLLIRDDLGVVVGGQVQDSGVVCFNFNELQQSVGLPAGTYYVVPLGLNWSRETAWVLDAIERHDPNLAHLPSVTLVAGDSKTMEVDCGQVLGFIRQDFGPP